MMKGTLGLTMEKEKGWMLSLLSLCTFLLMLQESYTLGFWRWGTFPVQTEVESYWYAQK